MSMTDIQHGNAPFPKRYDPQVLAGLKDRQAKLDKEAGELFEKIHNARETDQVLSPDQAVDLQVATTQFMALNSERVRLSNEVRGLESQRLVVTGEVRESPFVRLLRASAAAEKLDFGVLDDAERENMIGGMPDLKDMGQRLRINAAATRSDTDASGGHVVPETTVHKVIDRLNAYGGIEKVAQKITTPTGNELKYPQHDTRDQEGEIIAAQATNVSDQDLPAFTIITLNTKTMSSKRIFIAREFLQDAFFPVEQFVVDRMVRRIGRISAKAFTFGTGGGGGTNGINEFKGVIPTAKASVTAAATAAITLDELFSLLYDIEPAYLEGGEMGEGGLMSEMGSIAWVVSYDMCRLLHQMKDSEGRPLLVPNFNTAGAPMMLLGHPIVINYNMDDVAAGKVPIVFGNFGYYLIRTVSEFNAHMFWDSATAQNNTVAFLAFARRWSDVIGAMAGATCEAYGKLTMAAS